MRIYDPKLPLFSIHVPKCGGTSVQKTLRQWFGKRYYTHYEDLKAAQPPEHHNLRAGLTWRDAFFRAESYPPHVCVHGHFNNVSKQGVLDYYPDAQQFITILRDPFEQALSVYFYAKTQGNDWYGTGQANPNWATHQSVAAYLDNVMFKKPNMLPNYFPFTEQTPAWEKKLSNNFVYLGIVEDLDTSMQKLAARLDKPMPSPTHENRSHWDEPIPDGARHEYRARNPFAYALYDFALAHYRD